MLMVVVVLFAVAALIGLTMAIMHFSGKTPPPIGLALFHGAFAASGLVLLLVALWPDFSGRAVAALGVFVLAAMGGFTLALGFHVRGKMLPSGLVAGHGLLAVLGFLILLTVVFKP